MGWMKKKMRAEEETRLKTQIVDKEYIIRERKAELIGIRNPLLGTFSHRLLGHWISGLVRIAFK